MRSEDVKKLLFKVKTGKISIEKALGELKDMPVKSLDFANIDIHRTIRAGFPEVILCQGKTKVQIIKILREIILNSGVCLATRANNEISKAIKKIYGKNADCNSTAKTVLVKKNGVIIKKIGLVAVLTAGTSDIPVAEEAAVTAEATGSNVLRIYDVGVAGIHRLFKYYDKIRDARVVVAVAGMEGALPSVVGGLVDKPVIAVPTSIGYGANFGGVSALLSMLNSCSSNVVTVNIDNGFGAGYVSSMINKINNSK